MLTITGDAPSVSACAVECVITNEEREQLGLRVIDVLVAVPNEARGRLLGKDGCNISRITLTSGAHVTVASHHEVEVVVSIRALVREAVLLALDMVLFVEAYHLEDAAAAGAQQPEPTDSFLIPSRLIGRIFGLHGYTLEAIRFESRCKIQVASHTSKTLVFVHDDAGNMEGTFYAQIVSLTGGLAARRIAKALLTEHLSRAYGQERGLMGV